MKRVNVYTKIPGDYQYNAIHKGNSIQRQWHKNRHNLVRFIHFFSKKDNVLDIGCGSGNILLEFHPYVADMVGIDNNDECISFLKNLIKKMQIQNVRVIKKDIKKFKPLKKKFHKIVMTEFLEHFSEEDILKILKLCKKMLHKEGKILITTPNYKSLWPIFEYLIDTLNLGPKLWGNQHITRFTQGRLIHLTQKAGFKVEKIGSLNGLSPFITHISPLLADYISYKEFLYLRFGNVLYAVIV